MKKYPITVAVRHTNRKGMVKVDPDCSLVVISKRWVFCLFFNIMLLTSQLYVRNQIINKNIHYKIHINNDLTLNRSVINFEIYKIIKILIC